MVATPSVVRGMAFCGTVRLSSMLTCTSNGPQRAVLGDSNAALAEGVGVMGIVQPARREGGKRNATVVMTGVDGACMPPKGPGFRW